MKNVSKILPGLFILLLFGLVSTNAQSSNVDNPTPISSNLISGKIMARDIGDPRSTVHYYVFEGNQGDILLKVESNNLNGDIDIFYADNLRPVTKISLYADTASTETGREIYLRKSERLILRVEGRTPTDDPATYSIKFEGSFVALASSKTGEQKPQLSTLETENEGEIKVNSVGTIIETPKPEPIPAPRENTTARNSNRRKTRGVTVPQPVSTIEPKTTSSRKETSQNEDVEEREKKAEIVVSDNLPTTEAEKNDSDKTEKKVEAEGKPKTTRKNRNLKAKRTTSEKEPPTKIAMANQAAELAKAMENIRLVVEFKDGTKIERPMNEVMRFGVDKGVLTIVNKNGKIGRYSILEVAKITIE